MGCAYCHKFAVNFLHVRSSASMDMGLSIRMMIIFTVVMVRCRMNSRQSFRRNAATGVARVDKQDFERFYRKCRRAHHDEQHSKTK